MALPSRLCRIPPCLRRCSGVNAPLLDEEKVTSDRSVADQATLFLINHLPNGRSGVGVDGQGADSLPDSFCLLSYLELYIYPDHLKVKSHTFSLYAQIIFTFQ